MTTKYKQKSKPLLGILFSLISALSFANVYIFSKLALNQVNFNVFGFYWFLTSLTINTILFFVLKIYNQFLKLGSKKIIFIAFLGIIELISTVLFFYSIKIIENPTIIAFLTNLIPVFVAILSYVFLKERFTKLEYIGIFLAIIGIYLVGLKDNKISFKEFLDLATVLIIISSFLIAVNTVLIKKYIGDIHPIAFGMVRVFFLFSYFAIVVFLQKINIHIDTKPLLTIAAGAIFGPVIGVLLSIYALRHTEATIMSILVSTKSFITLILVYLVFAILPKNLQIIGGVLSFIGVVLISLGQHYYHQKNKI